MLDIKEITEMFTDDLERETDNRNAAQDDIRFAKLGEQWPEEVKSARAAEGRPCLTINKHPSFIRQVVNDSRINSPQIKVKPVDDDADPETAEILSGLVRNIEYSSQADIAYDTALDSSATCGMGFFKVVTDYCDENSFAQDLFIRRITNPLSVVYDSYGESLDGSDWNRCTEVEWLPLDQFKRKYGKEKTESFAALAVDVSHSDDSDQIRIGSFWHVDEEAETLLMLSDGTVITKAEFEKPQDQFNGASMKTIAADMGLTVARERKTMKRKVRQYVCGADIIETNEWAGKYIPIIPVFGDEVFLDGKRILKSLIRDAKDAQKMFNYWRTATTELVALAPKTPFIGAVGAFDTDADKWATANTKSHPFIEYDGQIAPTRQPFVGVPAGAMQEAMNASDDMKAIIGLYDASLGARSNETSGKAINARKQEGDVATFHFTDNKNKSIAHCGRVLVDLIPKIYDTERVIRIIGIDGETENVPLKTQTKYKGVERIFDLQVGKYDVAVDAGPSFTTQREEAATQMMELLRTFPAAAPIIGDLLAKNLNWPGADEIAKRLKTMLPPQIQALDQNELPPEAQAKIQTLQDQMQQMGQAMQQGMGEFKKVIDELETLKQDKALENRKLDLEQEKINLDRSKLDMENMKVTAEVDNGRMEAGATGSATNALLAAIASFQEMISSNMGNKEIVIQAPSGNIYRGAILDAPENNQTEIVNE